MAGPGASLAPPRSKGQPRRVQRRRNAKYKSSKLGDGKAEDPTADIQDTSEAEEELVEVAGPSTEFQAPRRRGRPRKSVETGTTVRSQGKPKQVDESSEEEKVAGPSNVSKPPGRRGRPPGRKSDTPWGNRWDGYTREEIIEELTPEEVIEFMKTRPDARHRKSLYRRDVEAEGEMPPDYYSKQTSILVAPGITYSDYRDEKNPFEYDDHAKLCYYEKTQPGFGWSEQDEDSSWTNTTDEEDMKSTDKSAMKPLKKVTGGVLSSKVAEGSSSTDKTTAESSKSTVKDASHQLHKARYERHYLYHDGSFDYLPYVEAERKNCHWCQIISFQSHERYPISIVNQVNDEALPYSFKFIENCVFRDGVDIPSNDFRTGCECKSNNDCKNIGCQCLQDMEESDADQYGKITPYHSEGDRNGCLRGAKLESRDPIYECHAFCKCSAGCSNRVIERGRKIPLTIFRTTDRGWGVKSIAHIKKGQFIDKYLGEVITSEEASQRRLNSKVAQRKDVYLFALDKFSDPDSQDPRLAGPAYEIDGEFYSGPTRFINHSCNPNLRSFARVGDHADKPIHDIAFFAMEDIPAGTELTFDYVDGVDGEDLDLLGDKNDPKRLKDMTKCLCGSKNCRGFLW